MAATWRGFVGIKQRKWTILSPVLLMDSENSNDELVVCIEFGVWRSQHTPYALQALEQALV